jgi:hypothetical protein
LLVVFAVEDGATAFFARALFAVLFDGVLLPGVLLCPVLLAVVVAARPAKAQRTDMQAAAWKNFIGKQEKGDVSRPLLLIVLLVASG